ncbi:SGNH/GDSL hydrolase family protein [Dinghuibacter silviterrae]|uniref:GDSL-like lipase/acylhydrolase family protein n=1 Tax=Dinghuibacter silviterrae TaxID=1539049 RepID=A0A4R8DHE1_9BACT|nr:tetratricopeptide repeat protein [Dinghuibacter silviterrae]TDW96927.1 GDSL-like lipase/acylhydrolase family protein [Dinghuibacter silviterrae]
MVKRALSYKRVAVILPFLLLCLLELGLRVCHYGRDLSLFIDDPQDHRYLVFNPDAPRRYLPGRPAPADADPFLKVKAPGSLRIFVLGESNGYPYPRNASFHRWLQYRLMHTFPGRTIEVVNLSLTDADSYTVLGFARELAPYRPDAVLIYTGHNEYGEAPAGSILQWLRGQRTFQLVSSWFTRKKEDLRANIAYGSAPYWRGVTRFDQNMRATLSLLGAQRIPVFLSNLVSNDKDLEPFASAPGGSSFDRVFDDGLRAFRARDSSAAAGAFLRADTLFPGHALCCFYLGRLAYAREDYAAARTWLGKARDLDELRFRAPDTLNRLIASLCKEFPDAHLVDTKDVFQKNSTGGIPGDELFLDHLHPNLDGYRLMSDAFYKALAVQGFAGSSAVCTMPITRVDSLVGVDKAWRLKGQWPFPPGTPRDPVRVATVEEELAFNIVFRHKPWSDAMGDLYDYYIKEKDLAGARTVKEALALDHQRAFLAN